MYETITAETLEDWFAEVDKQIPPPLTDIIGNPLREEIFHQLFHERLLAELERRPELSDELNDVWISWCGKALV